MSYKTVRIIGTTAGVIVGIGLSWIITCGLIWAIDWCFGWVFTWKTATGCWLVALVFRFLFGMIKTKK